LIVDLVPVEDFHHHSVLDIGFWGIHLAEPLSGRFGGWIMREPGISDWLLATDDWLRLKSLEITFVSLPVTVEPRLHLDRLALSLRSLRSYGWR
jgi:hypothetical protein